ncbi:MAG: NYN domain-containing protein [Patescibacteria group bacterium]
MPKRNNYAFIDAQNLYLGVKELGWELDMQRFHRYLLDKYGITKAFLFIGKVPGNESLYTSFERAGYFCIFKPTLKKQDGTIKGNCDAELVLHTMIEYPNFEKAVIVTGDGDFRCLVEYLLKQDKLEKVLVPNEYGCSHLLKSLSSPDQNILVFINTMRGKVEKKYFV